MRQVLDVHIQLTLRLQYSAGHNSPIHEQTFLVTVLS